MKILVLEDDPAIRRFLARGLREEGHEVTVVGDLEEARAVLSHRQDLLLVDRMLPATATASRSSASYAGLRTRRPPSVSRPGTPWGTGSTGCGTGPTTTS